MATDYLAELCSSRVVPKLIAYFIMHPKEICTYADVCRAIGEDRDVAKKQFQGLERRGFILSMKRGIHYPRYRLNPDYPIIPELQRIVVASRRYPSSNRHLKAANL
ncbi:MAG: hypothetical protein KGL39_53155 [Patescibacteria group bacterium]|nr:hypothetical protein [Patescibacteria group bacterium]